MKTAFDLPDVIRAMRDMNDQLGRCDMYGADDDFDAAVNRFEQAIAALEQVRREILGYRKATEVLEG